mgnify:CR=1 FL=1
MNFQTPLTGSKSTSDAPIRFVAFSTRRDHFAHSASEASAPGPTFSSVTMAGRFSFEPTAGFEASSSS